MERESTVVNGEVPQELLLKRMEQEFGNSPDYHDRYLEAASELQDEGLIKDRGSRDFATLSLTDKGRRVAKGR